MEAGLKTRVSRYMSYLLRHCPQNLEMDAEGFVNVDELLGKIRALLSTRQMSLVDKNLILEIVDGRNGKRFEVKGDRIDRSTWVKRLRFC